MTLSIMIVAGEVSGDLHAGNMLAELRHLVPEIEAFGIGGERLASNGLDCVATTDELAHMGLVEVLRELPRIRRIMARLVEEAGRRRPELAILVDSPDFNLRVAARLRRLGIPVVLYVSPQLWAWRQGRVRTVRRVPQAGVFPSPPQCVLHCRFRHIIGAGGLRLTRRHTCLE